MHAIQAGDGRGQAESMMQRIPETGGDEPRPYIR